MKGQKTGGRQKGTPNKRTAEIQRMVVTKSSCGGVTEIGPIEVLLKTMRVLWDEALKWDINNPEGRTLRLDGMLKACAVAEKCAPYLHPKLAAVAVAETKQDEMRDITPMSDLDKLNKLVHVLSSTSYRLNGSKH